MSSTHNAPRRTDDTRSPEDIEHDIERTRAEVGATIDAIQEKLTPGQVMDQALQYLRANGAGDFGRTLGRQVRDNPLPVALIGLGVAWLAMGGRMRTDPDEPGLGERMVQAGSDAGGQAREALSGAAGRVRDTVADTTERVKETVSDAARRARHLGEDVRAHAGSLQDRTRVQVDRARERTMRMVDEQPLVLGAVGVAIGAALGAALPATRREDALLGSTRDGLLEGAGAMPAAHTGTTAH
jgi:ElaB/YqjD/DUF883 family membrane-anchored ribosome-binding protein